MLVPRFPRSPCCMLLAAILPAPVLAQAAEHWFSIRGRSEFADVQAQLQVVVDEHAHQRTNRFCVVGEAVEGSTEAWVYWPEEGKLILWRPDRDNPHAIAGSKRYLDLKRDVVEGNDVHGSTYRLTRSTADEKIRACGQHGEIHTIELPAGSGAHG
jgi:hypothetical protein